MEKYYIYCSNNLAYHALLNNAILAKAETRPDFQENSASFISEDHIFVTKQTLGNTLSAIGIPDQYYPVTLEIEDIDSDSSIPARFVILDENGSISISDKEEPLSNYDNNKNCIGAFILGEIPITYLSGIIFDSDEHKMEFKKSSPDLWFPSDLFKLITDAKSETNITESLLKQSAELIGQSIKDADKVDIRKLILDRTRFKAACYFGIDATNDWAIDSVKTNFDSTLISQIDKSNKELSIVIERKLSPLAKSGFLDYDRYLQTIDEALDTRCKASPESRRMFEKIIQIIGVKAEQGKELAPDVKELIFAACIDEADDKEKIKVAVSTVQHYLTSSSDPDETLLSLKHYPILRSLMIFLDQQINTDFMQRSATKLTQYERRYTYVMFGFLNGMAGVERSQKSNRDREYRLEELACERYHDDRLINTLLPQTESTFMRDSSSDSICGLQATADVWFSVERSQQILLELSPEELEKVYPLWEKSMKLDSIPADELYPLKNPIEITFRSGEREEKHTLKSKEEAKLYGKKAEMFAKSLEVEFNVEAFKKHLSDKKKYAKFFTKNEEKIQQKCKRASP